MKIYSTLSQKKETFKPVKKDCVGIYVCGPTVYDVGHLGHARSVVSFDVIRRYFIYKGYKVMFVSNITDVDDKIIKRSASLGISENELAEKVIPEYQKDYGLLGVIPPDFSPRATQYIPKMVDLIEKLVQKGFAYATDDGVYFDVPKYAHYGELSHQKLDELQAGARVAVDEKKKNPSDFALWKKEKPGEPAWDGPGGMRGRPGWHIECSAMSLDLLGGPFDIHGGGIDLQFPHHEGERAQNEAVTGHVCVKYWLHNGHIRVNSEKMSKSLGNFFTIKEILAKYNPVVVRYFLLSTHYRMPIEFSNDLLEQAKNSLSRLHDFMRRLNNCSGLSEGEISIGKILKNIEKKFDSAMDNDFEIAEALAAIFELVKEINALLDANKLNSADVKATVELMAKFDSVLAVLAVKDGVDAEVEKLIAERNSARKNKDFKRADEIRQNLLKKGIELEDSKDGTIWKKML